MRAFHFKTSAVFVLCFAVSNIVLGFGQTTQTSSSESLTNLRERADQGNADAQLALGKIYRDGKKAPQDFKEAAVWLRKAADQGNAEAQERLSMLYYNGQGVSRDIEEAIRWLRKAADQGYAPAEVLQ